MPGGSSCRRPKRKRNWDMKYPSFPGDSPLHCRRADIRTVGAASSLSEAWLRCEEGFQDTSGTQSLAAEKKAVTEEHLELVASPKKETATSKSTNELTDITWSSSGSDWSDEDKLQFDWESDSDREDTTEYNESKDGESVVEISDCSSCASNHSLTSEEKVSELPKASSTEILEYLSDSENKHESENVLFIDSESSHKYHVDFESDGRLIMEKLINPTMKSTDNFLYTPQKQTKFPRTPENSTKKKQLLRGGLAERLNGLQNRERSSISLWRHQCVSYQKTLSDSTSGILIVKILELHEECTMQVAICEQLVGLQADYQSQDKAFGIGLKVLFTKETAHYLKGHPQDVIRIYPPWQKLIIPNGSSPVILNTYFCQKVVAKKDSRATQEVHCWNSSVPRRNITLAQMFRFRSLTNNSPESQVLCNNLTTMRTNWTHRHEEAKQHFSSQASLKDSLLDTIESQGASTWSGVEVPVVVQRVYSLHCRCQQGGSSAAPPSSDPPRVRVCLLVQDAYGIFCEVHLEGAILKDRQLEGKSCSLAGMKVLQKATRGRTAGLFSLIDTMWPPAMPLKAPGHGQACEELKTHLPPPSFCYVLTAHPHMGQVDIIEEDPISKLYQPPVPRFLREILQTDDLGARCSFYARVIYQRPLLNSILLLEQMEIWLVVTDVTLQIQDENNSGLPKTLPVCVTSSCVLDQEVVEVLNEAAPHSFFFRDALRVQGRIICVERTVLLRPKPILDVASITHSCELSGPVKLDDLGSVTQINSVCSVQGTVIGVDESTAFSWPTCDLCGNGRLEQSPEDRGAFSCADCSHVVTSPLLRRQLLVFLDCPSRPQCRVRVKGYELNSVIGKEMGSLNCFVQSITTHPASCIALEEIELLSAKRAS